MPINTQEHGNSQAFSETNQRDNASATNRQDQRISLSGLKKYLEGAHFPATKKDLEEYARGQQAPEHILNLLGQLQTSEFGSTNTDHMTEYNSLDEVIQEVEKVEQTKR